MARQQLSASSHAQIELAELALGAPRPARSAALCAADVLLRPHDQAKPNQAKPSWGSAFPGKLGGSLGRASWLLSDLDSTASHHATADQVG